MMLSSLKLQKTANEFTTYIGIDSPEYATSLDHFNRYSKNVVYHFNSLGYRDDEWPVNINDQLWCVGDSFTVGLGQPFEEIWPSLIQKELGIRAINVSMNGASNDWIARRVCEILDNFNPKAILIQWSYLHRREIPNELLCDEDRALNFDINDPDDFKNFLKNLNLVKSKKGNTIIVHSFIPKFFDETVNVQDLYALMHNSNEKFFEPPDQVDFSRDGYHYDIGTAKEYARLYIQKIKND